MHTQCTLSTGTGYPGMWLMHTLAPGEFDVPVVVLEMGSVKDFLVPVANQSKTNSYATQSMHTAV